MINDQYIINEFFTNKKEQKHLMIKKKRFKNATNEEIEYIRNRYSDSESDSESLKRIYYHIDIKPKCPVCGNTLKFIGIPSRMFHKFCSPKCAQNSKETRDKMEETCLEKYGVVNGGGSKQALDKIRQTCQKKYGVSWTGQIPLQKQHVKETFLKKYNGHPNKTEFFKNKIRKTCLEKYGVVNGGGSKQALDKIRQTCQKKYGVNSPFSIKSVKTKIRETNIKRYGYPIAVQSNIIKDKLKEILNKQEVKDKIYKTMKENNSFNKSLDEKLSFLYLSLLYPDTKTQIRYSNKKRYISDFYIPCLDLYIECDYHWTHGGHAFNPNSVKDIEKVKYWESKHTKYYNNAINVWTKKDIEKDEFIKSHNIRCIHFFTLQELIDWLNY